METYRAWVRRTSARRTLMGLPQAAHGSLPGTQTARSVAHPAQRPCSQRRVRPILVLAGDGPGMREKIVAFLPLAP